MYVHEIEKQNDCETSNCIIICNIIDDQGADAWE